MGTSLGSSQVTFRLIPNFAGVTLNPKNNGTDYYTRIALPALGHYRGDPDARVGAADKGGEKEKGHEGGEGRDNINPTYSQLRGGKVAAYVNPPAPACPPALQADMGGTGP